MESTFSDLWKLTEGLHQSRACLFKKNSWNSVRTVGLVVFSVGLLPSLLPSSMMSLKVDRVPATRRDKQCLEPLRRPIPTAASRFDLSGSSLVKPPSWDIGMETPEEPPWRVGSLGAVKAQSRLELPAGAFGSGAGGCWGSFSLHLPHSDKPRDSGLQCFWWLESLLKGLSWSDCVYVILLKTLCTETESNRNYKRMILKNHRKV